MSMTKKQKEKEIPKLKAEVEEIKRDVAFVKSPISKRLLQEEIERMEETISEYETHVADPYVNRRR